MSSPSVPFIFEGGLREMQFKVTAYKNGSNVQLAIAVEQDGQKQTFYVAGNDSESVREQVEKLGAQLVADDRKQFKQLRLPV